MLDKQLISRRQGSITLYVGLGMVGIWIVSAVAAPWVTPYVPSANDYSAILHAPSLAHPLGTDQYGRDVLSRLIYGGRSVLAIAPPATLLSVTLGGLLGIGSAYASAWIDEALMRFLDAIMALPVIVLAMLVLVVLGPSAINQILVIGLIFTPLIARTARSAALPEVSREYVAAARLLGERTWRIIIFELLPNVRRPLIVEGTIRLAYAVFTAATLGFLGLGAQPPTSDWGLMVGNNRGNLTIAPWTVLAPSLAIAFVVVAISLITDGLEQRAER